MEHWEQNEIFHIWRNDDAFTKSCETSEFPVMTKSYCCEQQLANAMPFSACSACKSEVQSTVTLANC